MTTTDTSRMNCRKREGSVGIRYLVQLYCLTSQYLFLMHSGFVFLAHGLDALGLWSFKVPELTRRVWASTFLFVLPRRAFLNCNGAPRVITSRGYLDRHSPRNLRTQRPHPSSLGVRGFFHRMMINTTLKFKVQHATGHRIICSVLAAKLLTGSTLQLPAGAADSLLEGFPNLT